MKQFFAWQKSLFHDYEGMHLHKRKSENNFYVYKKKKIILNHHIQDIMTYEFFLSHYWFL